MIKRPLDILFSAMYRGKLNFDDMKKASVGQMYEVFTISGREVVKPTPELKNYLSFLGRVLFNKLPVDNASVFSYRKGVSLLNAVEKHAASKFFLQVDIADFFGSIDESLIRETILASEEACPISDVKDHLEMIVNLVTVGSSLPAGYPTSPAISNACLYGFDKRLKEVCDRSGLIYTRYSDDLIVSGSDSEMIGRVYEVIKEILLDEFGGRLEVNQSKTKFTRPGQKVKLLGINILPNGAVSVDKKFKKDAEVKLYYYLKDRAVFVKMSGGTDLEKAVKNLSGIINYINTVDSVFLDKLRKKYGSTLVDMFLHRSTKLLDENKI